MCFGSYTVIVVRSTKMDQFVFPKKPKEEMVS